MKISHPMMLVAVVAVALVAVTACSSDDDADVASSGGETTVEDAGGAYGQTNDPTDGEGTESAVALGTLDSDLGVIVVDGTGNVVYRFDADEQGASSSSCEGQCAQTWPAVPGSDAPQLDGVTGEVSTITGVNGEPQLTLDGWPLYYYAGDQAPGDTNGQGIGGVWWVITPEGEPVNA